MKMNKLLLLVLVIPFCLAAKNPSTEIVGGEKVTDPKDPVYQHSVRLLVKSTVSDSSENPEEVKGIKFSQRCSGTLIRQNIVLTASHCLPKKVPTKLKNKNVILDIDLSKIDIRVFTHHSIGGDYSGIKSKKVIRHPGFDDLWYFKLNPEDLWNPEVPINDIALIVMEEDAPSYKKPASLYQGEFSARAQDITLAGYGKTANGGITEKPHLRKVTVPFREYLNNGKDFFVGKGNIDDPSEDSDPQGGCFGDSGGSGYYINQDGTYSISGVLVRGPNGDKGGCKASVTIMTGVNEYLDFIEQTLVDLGSL